MKRLFAAVLILCLLLTMSLPVFAAPEDEAPPEDAVTEETGEETGEELPVTDPEPEPIPEPEVTVDPLANETAIRRAEITCIVDEKGTATMSLTLKMQIIGVLEELRFAVPENAKNREINGYKPKSQSEKGISYLVISSKTGFSGEQTFTMTYTLSGLVSKGEESQKLDVPLLAPQEYRTGEVALAVNLPKAYTSSPRFTSGYYGEIIEDYMTVSTSSQAATAVVNVILQDNDSLSMQLTVPEGYFSGNFGEGGLSRWLTVLVILLVVLALLYWWRTLQNAPLRVQSRTLPPDGVNPGDLPWLLAGTSADFNLLASHWANLGYLSFYVNKSGHVILQRRMPMGNERRPYERKLFGLLFGHEDICDGASMRYKKVGERAMAMLPRYWGKRLFEKNSGSPALMRMLCCLACALATVIAMDEVGPDRLHGLFLLIGFVAGFALCWLLLDGFGRYYLGDMVKAGIGVCCGLLLLILGGLGGIALTMAPAVGVAAFLGWQTVRGGRRSAYGTEVLSQTLGFRRFLLHANDYHVQQMLRRDPQYFYKMLPYAEAVGQGRRFVALFHDVELEPCPWFEVAGKVPTSAGSFYHRYMDAMDMLNLSIQK